MRTRPRKEKETRLEDRGGGVGVGWPYETGVANVTFEQKPER